VERILNAAIAIFSEVGFDAATTEAIAERAEVSIGSLYQYFPNKEALFDAVGEEYHAREKAVFEKQLLAVAMTNASADETIDRMVDAFDYLKRTEPSFRAVWLNSIHSPRVLEAGLASNVEFAQRAEALAAMHAPALTPERRRLVARVVVEILSTTMFISLRMDDEMAREFVEEMMVVLKRYLAPILREGRAPDARPRKSRT
jgi:AcrR family transcriptional regulator